MSLAQALEQERLQIGLIPIVYNARHKKGHDMAYLIEGFGAIKLHNCYPLAWNLNASKSWKMFSINKTQAISKGSLMQSNTSMIVTYTSQFACSPFGLLFQDCNCNSKSVNRIELDQSYIFQFLNDKIHNYVKKTHNCDFYYSKIEK